MFEPWNLGGLALKNRVIKAGTHDGGNFEEFRQAYRRLAQNDVALITVAYVAVSKTNKTFDSQHHIAEDNAEEWLNVIESVKAVGGKMSAQLHHPGLFCMASDGVPMGPSLFYLPSKATWPKTLTIDDIGVLKKEFVDAAVLCKKVGFECLELHCGHGYLLSQFLTPIINRRGDKYGGSAKKRAQLPVEIAQEIRVAVGEEFPIVVKMNTEDGLPFPGGLRVEDSLVAARRLAEEGGVDAIIPSFGYTGLNGLSMLRGGVPLDKMVDALPNPAARFIGHHLGSRLVPKVEYESLFLWENTKKYVDLLKDTKTKVIYVGGADSFQAIEDVIQGGCSAVQLARPLLREPYFVKKVVKDVRESEKLSDVDTSSRCVRCNMCTLAAIDPERFKAGCIFLKPTDGRDIEDLVVATPRL